MIKTISAGVLLENHGKFLIGHPTELTGTTHGWGILKGKVDEGESLFTAAKREFQEESGVNIDVLWQHDQIGGINRPFFKYKVKQDKVVYVFWLQDWRGIVMNSKLSCPSLVPNTDKPEIDDYKWVTPDEAIDLVTDSQKDLFKLVKSLTDIK